MKPSSNAKTVGPIEPLLKWAGGKRALISQILPEIKYVQGRYFEPFVGGAAIFFHLLPEEAYLSDINSELIECYEVLKNSPDCLAKRLGSMENSEGEYYRVRGSRPRTPLGRAARFIYLTSLSFNGIYRQNLRGEFNVPYGKKLSKSLPNIDALRRTSAALQGATLRVADFEEATTLAAPGDTIYFDPPYTVAHNNNGFVKYNKQIFSWTDQIRLAAHAERLANRGCNVIISNADHYSVRALYPAFQTHVVRRNSVIAASSNFRKEITECLFVSLNHNVA